MTGSRSRNWGTARSSTLEVHDHDVLSGRGVNIAQHSGNERFRSLVSSRYDERYCSEFTTAMKQALAREVIDHIKNLKPPGRFLKREGRSQGSRGLEGPWEELTDKECMKKATQALRDCNRQDRTGYAKQVQAPQDVKNEEMKRSGVSLKDHAEAKVQKQSKSQINSYDPHRPTSQEAKSRKRNGSVSSNDSASHVKRQRVPEPLPVLSQEPSFVDSNGSMSSAAHALAGPSTFDVGIEATPAHPHAASIPVTETPGSYHPSYSRAPPSHYGAHHFQHAPHHHHPDHHHSYSGSPHASSPYHPSSNQGHYSYTPAYSPVTTSRTTCDHNANNDDSYVDELIGQNLFVDTDQQEEDPFHSVAANASAGLPSETADDSFGLIHHDHRRNGSNEHLSDIIF